MPTSEARINANRFNAQMSTGPRSTQGKAISRRNGLKHGLTGAGIVLLEEDSSESEVRVAAFLADFDPRSAIGEALVGQMATLSIRMEQCARREEEATASRVRHAAEVFDFDRVDRAEELFDTLADDPRGHLRLLRRMPEGVDRLLEAWGELREVLTQSIRPTWTDSHRELAANLLGKRPEQDLGSRVDLLGRAVRGESVDLADPEWARLDPEGRLGWAVARLVERIDSVILDLREHRESLDLESLDLDRLGAPGVALFDSSRDATLARRYEADASRRFFKSLKELRQVEAEAADRPAPKPVPMMAPPMPVPTPPPLPRSVARPEPARVAEPLGSSCAGAASTSRQAEPTAWEWPEWSIAPRDCAARGLDGRVISIGRAGVMPR
jgi:hypothetical protein